MDEQQIASKTNRGKRIDLHDRIIEFSKSHGVEGDLLLAVKYVGNEATHTELDAIDANDVLDMAEFIEVALGALYASNNDALVARAKRIVAAKQLVK
jgi:hypothetical protein